MASMDLNVYEQLQPVGKRLAWEQDLHFLLHDEPNPEMTSYTFIRTLQCHALLWGNAYAEIERDQANRALALWPRNPNNTRPVRLTDGVIIDHENYPAGTMVYQTVDGTDIAANKANPVRYIPMGNMIHLPGLSLDGRLGKSVVELSRQVMGLALAMEKFGGKFFANGIRPTGVIEMPQDMNPVAFENYKRSVRENQGGENQLTPLVLEAGMKWVQHTISPNEGQFLESRKFQREEIGAIFHVPVRLLGEAGRSNKATAEQEGIELVQYTFRPWIRAWQPELKRKLFTKVGRTANKFFPSFYFQDMLTPDAESRGKFIGLLKQWGVANTDDIREEFLDWNPIGGPAGKTYWMPVNFMDASEPTPPEPLPMNLAHPTSEGKEKDEDDTGVGKGAKTDVESKSLIRAYSGLFRRAFQGLLARNTTDSRDFHKAFHPLFMSIAETIRRAALPAWNAPDDGSLSGDEVQRFIGDYLEAMYRRVSSAKVDEEFAGGEMIRAIKAVRVAVYRDIATQIAKAEVVQ
jgi:HK97 family phage portal protein